MNLQTLSGRRIWAVLKKEFIQLLRDKTTLRMIIGIPIMQLLLFGFAINSDPKHLPTAVIAQDHSVFARDILPVALTPQEDLVPASCFLAGIGVDNRKLI